MTMGTPADFLDTLEAVRGDATRNISELGCQQRRDGAGALFVLSALLTLVLKIGLLQSAAGVPRRKIVYYPVSVMWCCAVVA
jgi:hypothetical protein